MILSHFGGLPKARSLFLDLDDVMADFDGYFEALFGVPTSALPDDEMWAKIHLHGSYFRSLPPCPGALHFFRCIKHLKPIILTACPKDDFANVAQQKRGWVRAHLGDDVPMIPSPGGGSKVHYMHAPGDILIDDFERNVRRWERAGGFGIHHSGDFVASMLKLSEYLWPNPYALDTSRAQIVDLKTTSPATMTATRTASLQDAATVNLPEEKPIRLTPA